MVNKQQTNERGGTLTLEKAVETYAKFVDFMPVAAYEPWEKQNEAHKADFEIRILAWANRTGKTTLGAAECVLAGMGVHSKITYPRPPFTIWVVSTSYPQQEDTIIPAFEGDSTHPRTLPKGVKLNRNRMTYKLPSGSIIRLKTSEARRESFQGAGIPLIWLDEDHPVSVLKEIFARIGPGYKRRILWTVTAVNGLIYAYHQFYVPWLEAQRQGQQHPRIWCSQASMDECPYLTSEQIDDMCALYPAGSKEYEVRRRGGFVDIAGGSFFEEKALTRLGEATRPGIANLIPEQIPAGGGKGRPVFKDVKGVSDIPDFPKGFTGGPTTLYESVRGEDSFAGIDTHLTNSTDHAGDSIGSLVLPDSPSAGSYLGPSITIYYWPGERERFCLGSDVAEGRLSDPGDIDSERDFSCSVVYSRDYNRVAAVLRSRQDPHTFALWSYLLGWFYNWAWECPELNNNGVAVIGVLRGTVRVPGWEWLPPYPRIYVREIHMDYYSSDINPDLLGFKTTVSTRPKLLSDGYDLVCKTDFVTHDAIMVEEFKTFAYNKQGKVEHGHGFHDDMIWGLFLAHQAHQQCPFEEAGPIAEQAGGVLDGPFDYSWLPDGQEGSNWYEDYEDVKIEVVV